MPHIPKRRGWEIPAARVTPEGSYWDRRRFLAGLARIGAGVALGAPLLAADRGEPGARGASGARGATPAAGGRRRYPAWRNPLFTLDRPLTDESVAARYNNFYEFTERADRVWQLVDAFEPRPWRIEIAGLVERPRAIDVDDLIRALPVEERLYRHRCVEAWAMAVPWTGAPMREFVRWARPLSAARHVRMVSFLRPEQAPGQRTLTHYPWPYYEGLRMDEAVNELSLLAFGIYGHDLPVQHGAPIRLVTPWKYGYKSAKSIVRFEFLDRQPPTFWNDVAPREYDYLSNVNPEIPHPRWSQATERMLGTDERRPTLPFNGYGEWVASLYGRRG